MSSSAGVLQSKSARRRRAQPCGACCRLVRRGRPLAVSLLYRFGFRRRDANGTIGMRRENGEESCDPPRLDVAPRKADCRRRLRSLPRLRFDGLRLLEAPGQPAPAQDRGDAKHAPQCDRHAPAAETQRDISRRARRDRRADAEPRAVDSHEKRRVARKVLPHPAADQRTRSREVGRKKWKKCDKTTPCRQCVACWVYR